jgi:hypothetical protein
VVQDRAGEVFGEDGFGDVVVHAGFAALPALLGHCVGGHGDDGQMAEAGVLADLAGRLEAVHHRHLEVHQDEVEGVGPGGVEGVEGETPVVGHVHGGAQLLQQAAGDELVDVVVFDQQDAQAGQRGGAGSGLRRRGAAVSPGSAPRRWLRAGGGGGKLEPAVGAWEFGLVAEGGQGDEPGRSGGVAGRAWRRRRLGRGPAAGRRGGPDGPPKDVEGGGGGVGAFAGVGQLGEELLEDVAGARVGVDHQHMQAGRCLGWQRRGRLGAAEAEREAEAAALAGLAADFELAAHQLDQVARDGEAQAGAAEAPGHRAVGLGEGLEEAGDLAGVHADAGVARR